MFSGLNNFLKLILPKRLFYRSLIIVAAPIIILQIIVTIVFFDSVWIKANKGMTRALVAELKLLNDFYSDNKINIDFLTDSYKNNFDFEISILDEKMPEVSGERKYSPMDRSLRRELKSTFGNNNYWFDTTKFKKAVVIKIKNNNKIIEFTIPKDKISTSSFRLFVLWITLPSVVLILIAIVFLKNQTRPIVNLSKAAERFGKGDYINEFRPSGASEIRKAAYEFDRMAKRINRHLNQRSEMLSGISHDLRTPLTRLKLQLELIDQKEITKKMSSDIDEMERMLNDYLKFAKTQSQEKTERIDVSELIQDLCKTIDSDRVLFENKDKIFLQGRKHALSRCFSNLIQNGLIYAEKIYITSEKTSNRARIVFDDNGPGIPEEEFKNVFKPFYRLDKSRSFNKSGIGLGLAIVEDIVNSHGGNVQLSKSNKGGLCVKVSLPF
jgi:two-component system osmolarity sensor histidine kinase EnvZ